MSRRIALVTVMAALVLVTAAGSAPAKGAIGATIEGPGGGDAVEIVGDGEPGGGQTLGMLATHTGFFAAAYGREPSSPLLSQPPPGDLGPEYTIRWVLPVPEGEDVLVQRLYPDAPRGPITFMPPGQPFWSGEHTQGGWYEGGDALAAVLADLDLPPAPAPPPNLAPVAATAALLLVACGAVLELRRRARRSTALAG